MSAWTTNSTILHDDSESTTMQDCVLGFASSVLALFTVCAAMIGHQTDGTLKPEEVTVYVVIDATSSMAPVLERTKEACRSLTEVASRISPRFRLELRLHRGGTKGDTFQLTEIGPTLNDAKHKGRVALDAFFDVESEPVTFFNAEGERAGKPTGQTGTSAPMSTRLGFVNPPAAMQEVAARISARPADERVVLIWIGDVGCHEIDAAPNDFTIYERIRARQALDTLKGLTAERPSLRVWSVFAGASLPHAPFRQETVGFFKDVAAAAGPRGSYTDDISSLTAAAIAAVFAQEPRHD